MLVTLAALVPAHAQTSVQNTATVALPPGSPVVDSNAANNTSTATVGVLALPRLTLVKQVVNDNGGTAAATAWTLVATGTSRTISGATGTAAVTGAAVPAGTYALSETGGPAAYTASTWSCVKNGGAAVSANSISLVGNDVATCTITNNDQAATLTLVKTVVNDNGGTATVTSFPLTATGPTTITGVSGAAAVTNRPVNAGVYTLSEVTAAGYAAGAWSCTAGTLSGSQLTLANGQSATCTITNNDRPATLTLVKTVVNDNGGTATVTSFPLTATGPTTITGVSGAAAVTNRPVNAGVYTLSEVTAAGYTAGAWSCTAGTLSGNQLTLANGQNATCTIVNNDQAATLTLVKTVVNDNGGTATITSFPLTATGPTTITGVSGTATVTSAPVSAGVYTLSEVTAAGYTAGAWSCTAGTLSGSQLTLANGQNATCTITNNDQAATLTLVKTVVNTGGGTASPTNWTLTATGPTSISGAGGATGQVSAGTYTLSESGGPADYVGSSWNCTAGTLAGDQLTLANGQSATCTIVNTFQSAPALTIDKTTTTPSYAAVGDVLSYSYLVTNSGNTTITAAITVSDDRIATVTCPALPAGGLAPTQSITCTATYTVTQADIDAGTVTNIASASDGTTTSPTDTVTVTATRNPALTIDKTTTTPSYAAVGDVLSYSYLVTNSGNTTITAAITVSDDRIATVTCPALPAGGLAPTQSITCTATYTVTQADIDAGTVTNIASASDGTTTSPTDTVTVTATRNPALTIDKTTTTPSYAAVGDVLSYSYLVTNSGNTTITAAITVSDDRIATVTCPALPAGGLAPTQSITCTATYTVTQADIDAGTVTNIASASDGTTTSPTDTVTVTATRNPALTIDKTTTTPSYAAVGDVLSYSYLVTNSGNTTITAAITVSDDRIATVTCPALPAGGLAPTQSITCTATYTVTQADIDAGTVTNIASASDGTTTSPTDTVTVTATRNPALTIDKTTTTPSYAAVGDVLSYSYLVTNSGNTTITAAITVSDDRIATVTCPALPAGGLAPTQSITCTATYTVTQADIDAGTVTNIASASDGTTTSPTDTVTVTATRNPALTIDKTTTTPSYAAVGDVLSYSYLVTNSGNTTITAAITVSDDRIATVTCPALPAGGLAPTQSITCTATYTVTQADIDAGTVTNIASASDGTTTSPTDTVTVTATRNPALTIDKTTTTPSYAAVGDVLSYSYLVTNSGNTTITAAITVSDDRIATVTCPALPAGGLAPTQSITCTATYTVTQADIDAGTVTNIASASDGTTTSPTDTVTVTATRNPALTIDKTTTTPSYAAVGDVLSYSYLVTNSGNTTITAAITVSDDRIATVTCPALPAGGLAPTQSITCTATYTVTQADIDAGTVTNIASASDGTTTSPTDTVTVTATRNPALTIDKTTTTPSYAAVGDVLSYSYLVTNSGNTTITAAITVSDDRIATVTCPALPAGGLAPTQSITCTATYTVTQADIDAGTVTNIASASDGTTTSPTDTVTVTATRNPALTIDKTTTTPSYAAVGDVLSYSYLVTNSGNTTITAAITVSDDRIATVTCPALPAGGLAPTQSITCTATYTVTQADIDAGTVTNIASASDGTTTSPTDTVTVTATRNPALTIDKTTTTPSYAAVGDVLSYSYLVTNSGNTTITAAITVSDDRIATVTCPALPAGGLAPTQSITCTATYTVTQADIDAGTVTNIASASDGTTTSPTDTVTVTATRNPALTIDKTTTTPSYAAVGDVLSYSYLVTNSGNTTITAAITVSDDRIATVTCPALPAGGLAPTQSITCTATYTVTQADIDAGTVTNIASASDGTTTSPTDTVTVTATRNPALTIDKTTTTPSYAAVGDVLSYSYLVTNSGNTTITAAITVSDDRIATVTCPALPAGGLAPTQSITCTATYTVTQADIDAGTVTNIASASDGTTTSPTDTVTVTATRNPALTIDKTTTTPSYAAVGDVLSYSYLVTNSGNTTITAAITVSDDRIATVTCPALPAGGLAPTQSITCTATYTVTQADIDAGTVTNIASASDGTTTSPTDTVTVTATRNPALTIDKTTTTPSYAAVGDVLSYSYLVTNSGNTTITAAITVSDDRIATVTCPALPAGGLAPTQSITCTATYTVTQADIDAGTVTNIASASDGTTTSPTDTVTVTATRNPALTIDKTTTTPSYAAVGDVLSYSYLVTNSGNTTITAAITVSDDRIATVTCPALPAGGLAPTQSITCTATYTVTQADIDAGTVTNIASASDGTTTSPTDTVTVTATRNPALTIDKTTTTPSYAAVGDVLSYSYLVTNSGNTTITAAITVSDDRIATVTCPALPAGGLAPTQSITCTATYTVTQADIDAGTVTNIASASDGTTTSPTDTVTVTATRNPALTIDKTTTTPSYAAVGDVLSYSYLVTNSGNTTITAAITVSDDRIATVTCPALPAGGLAPTQSITCTATYTVTQADIDAGTVTNIASASDGTTTSPTDTVTVTATRNPAQELEKLLTGNADGDASGTVSVGDVLTYTVTMTNTGNTTLANVVVSDALITPNSNTCASVAPGATCQLVGTYTVTQADADAGNIRNTAVVTSPVCPAGSTDPACTTTIDTPVPQTPSQTLVKALTGNADGDASGTVSVGDVLTYTVTMTNTGNTTLANVVVSDALITPNSNTCASVAPGATCQLVGTYTVTQADADAGNIRNTAVVTSPVCPAGSTDPACTTTIDTPVENPIVTYSKSVVLPSGQTEVSVGDALTYAVSVTVANARTTEPLTLTDTLGTGLDLGAVSAGVFSCSGNNPLVCTLSAGTVPGTYTVTYTATVNDQATGTVDNAVVGTGDDAPTCAGTCTTETPVTEPLPPLVTYTKSAALPSGQTEVRVGDTVTYTLTTTVVNAVTTSDVVLTDTLGTGLDFVAVTNAGAYSCNSTNPLVCTLPVGTVPGTYTVTYTATVNDQAVGTVDNAVVGTGEDAPTCAGTCTTQTPVVAPRVVVSKSSDPGTGAQVQVGQTVRYTLTVDISGSALREALVLVDTPDRGLTLGALPAGCTFDGTLLTCRLPAGTPAGVHGLTYEAVVNPNAGPVVGNQVTASGGGGEPPTCTTCSTEHELEAPQIRLSKTAGSREVRIGDLVRYTLTVENVGRVDLVNGSVVDTPAAGFSYVEGSLLANDADAMATVSGGNPLRFSGVDVAAGETATLVYVMRVGAGVRPGTHVNQAQVRSATDDPVSNVATAEVVLTADPLLDDSLVFGTVFNDRDGDGWQDSAALSGVKVQGGFAPAAYIANSTTVDRGAGPQPEPDASSPLLHGIAVGAISGRQSVADPVQDHEVVIRQRLNELSFTDDFVLTSNQGVTVRMDAAGNTRVEQSGEAAKGLNAATPTVERRVAQSEGGYVVDYVIRNTGIDERGIPGVRIASVEGLLIETDQYGRYHLADVSGGPWERGRNFILKVDPSTLPAGAQFTTDNPLLRRVTPGVPVRFDWGVKLPEQVIEGGTEQVELEMGEVFFAPGSAEVRAKYLLVIEAMAAKVRQYQGGEVVIQANGENQSLAFERANAVKAALLDKLDAASAKGLVVSARGVVDDPSSMIVGVDEGGALLGTVLFDTDKSNIRPEFEPLLDKVAAALEKMGGGSIAIVGHTDVRASHAYNVALGMRRAKAVYEALAQRLSPQVRANVRVEASNDPTAPVGVRK
ncbi:DUF7507 domain-containing protein [Pseudoxanthomonas mexicana]